jgi:hypothetical protein
LLLKAKDVMDKRDLRTLVISNKGADLNKLESYIESICDEFNVYNDCYGNLMLSIVSLYEQIVFVSPSDSKIKIDFFNSPRGLNFEFYTSNTHFLREVQVVLEERESIIDDDSYNWLFILEQLTDLMEVTEKSILIQFDIKSINAELAAARTIALKAYLHGQSIPKESYLN